MDEKFKSFQKKAFYEENGDARYFVKKKVFQVIMHKVKPIKSIAKSQ